MSYIYIYSLSGKCNLKKINLSFCHHLFIEQDNKVHKIKKLDRKFNILEIYLRGRRDSTVEGCSLAHSRSRMDGG